MSGRAKFTWFLIGAGLGVVVIVVESVRQKVADVLEDWAEQMSATVSPGVGEAGRTADSSRALGTVNLSPRELEVLELTAQGYTTITAAKKLGIAPQTVRTHRQRILSKLGAHTTAQAISVAYRDEILQRGAHDDTHASSGDAEGDDVRVPKTPGASSRVVVRDDETGSLETPYWCRVGSGYARHWADHMWEGITLTACGCTAGPPVTDWEEKYVAVCYWCKRRMQGEG